MVRQIQRKKKLTARLGKRRFKFDTSYLDSKIVFYSSTFFSVQTLVSIEFEKIYFLSRLLSLLYYLYTSVQTSISSICALVYTFLHCMCVHTFEAHTYGTRVAYFAYIVKRKIKHLFFNLLHISPDILFLSVKESKFVFKREKIKKNFLKFFISSLKES